MKPSERRKARHCATQAIYQWQMTRANVGDIEELVEVIKVVLIDQELMSYPKYFDALCEPNKSRVTLCK